MRWSRIEEVGVANLRSRTFTFASVVPSEPFSLALNQLRLYRLATVKKLYGMLHFGFERTLQLDAEVRLVRRTSMSGLFEAFHARPSFWYTKHERPSPDRQKEFLSVALRLNGLQKVPKEWRRVWTTAYDEVGVPRGAYLLDVQHWFYSRPLLLDLAQRLERLHGTIAKAICFGPGFVFDAILLLAHLFRFSKRTGTPPPSSFHDTQVVLRDAGLTGYADRLLLHKPDTGSGECLLQPYGEEADDEARYRKGLLSVIDNAQRPIFVYRELNAQTYLDLTAHKRNWSLIQRMLPMQRQLVCDSSHLSLSVCESPTVPFYCAGKAGARADDARRRVRVVVGFARREGWPKPTHFLHQFGRRPSEWGVNVEAIGRGLRLWK